MYDVLFKGGVELHVICILEYSLTVLYSCLLRVHISNLPNSISGPLFKSVFFFFFFPASFRVLASDPVVCSRNSQAVLSFWGTQGSSLEFPSVVGLCEIKTRSHPSFFG